MLQQKLVTMNKHGIIVVQGQFLLHSFLSENVQIGLHIHLILHFERFNDQTSQISPNT